MYGRSHSINPTYSTGSRNEPAFGKQAVYLDDANVPSDVPSADDLKSYAKQGIKIVAPPTWVLVGLQGNKIVPSKYAVNAKAAGLDIITWTLERSGTLTDGGGFYFQTVAPVIDKSGDTYELLDVLARGVGHSRYLLRLARHGDLLRELYGT